MSLLDNASLLLTPNAYKEGKLYSVIPSNGNGDFTATRATTATRVNSSGLVDLVPYNLLQYSEMFTDGIWSKVNAIITPNVTTAPNGTLTADKLIATNGTSISGDHIQQFLSKGSSSMSYTFTAYLKANELNGSRLYVRDSISSTNFAQVYFNLSTGTIEIAATSGGNFSSASATITSVGNGWYRVSLTFTSSADTQIQLRIFTYDTVKTTGNGTDGIFIWGAQIVEGTSARDYLRTETRLNIPRIDYSLGGCPNILLEPQRTNLIQRSSEFDNATWVKLNTTVTPNTTISPSGIQDADRIQITSATSNYLDNSSASLLTNGATYTVSVYVRSFGSTNQSFRIYGNGNKVSPILTATPTWQRFEYTFTATSTTPGCGISSSSITDIVAWGYQLEAGAYATSYIPTTTASVTRNADSIARNNIFTNGLITAAGGTWFVELRNNRLLAISSEDVGAGLELGDSTGASTNAFKFRRGGGTQRVNVWKVVGGTSTPLYSPSTDNSKIAIKWNGTTADVFENGVKVVAATSFTATNMDFLRYIQNQFPTYLNEMALFPTPLTDAQCIALTQ